MSTTTDGTQLSPCVELFIELLLDGASAASSREVSIVRQPQDVATQVSNELPANMGREKEGDFMSKLANKVALVTGGSRGIGAAVAKRLAANGANVAITYAKDAKAASAVVTAIETRWPKGNRDSGGRHRCRCRRSSGRKDRGDFRQVGRPCEQCRYGHSESVRGDDAGRDGSGA